MFQLWRGRGHGYSMGVCCTYLYSQVQNVYLMHICLGTFICQVWRSLRYNIGICLLIRVIGFLMPFTRHSMPPST